MGQRCHGFVLAALLAAVSSTHGLLTTKWTPETFPNPMTDVRKCNPQRDVASWICDPDHVLTREGADVLEGVIKLIAAGERPYARIPCGGDGYQGHEVGVAVMRRFKVSSGDDARTAETFAQALHAKWGVGRAACQNGVLLLLSIENRQLYISTGAGTQRQLTYGVLGDIIDEAKPLLKQSKYDDAVQHAVVNIGLALAGVAIEKQGGEGSGWFGLAIFLGVIALFVVLIYKSVKEGWRQTQRYKNCRTLLDRLKRDQAALQGGAYAVTSCPVCLEEFELDTSPESPETGAGAGADSADAAGVSSSERDPLLNADTAAGSAGASTSAGTAPAAGAGGSAAGAAAADAAPPVRRPLVLPCGHVFCESCIGGWIAQRKTSCPICRRSMETGDNAPPPPAPGQPCHAHQAAWEHDFPQAVLFDAQTRMHPRIHVDPFSTRRYRWRGQGAYTLNDMRQRGYGGTLTQEQAQDLMRQDLLFRLQALRRRYPDFVTQDMVRTWGDDVSSGREFSASALRAFQLSDPAVRRELAHHGSSGASSSFGGGRSGGRSSGGRGGSW